MSRRHRLTRHERIKKSREEWEQYGPAILGLMDRIDQLERTRGAVMMTMNCIKPEDVEHRCPRRNPDMSNIETGSTAYSGTRTTIRAVRCKICGRWLSNPVSVERGIGPVCWARQQTKEAENSG